MTRKTNVLVANETGHTPNPGCRAVRRGLDRLFALSEARKIASLPLGHWASEFEALAPSRAQRLRHDKGTFTRGTMEAPPLDLDGWRRIRDELARNDSAFMVALDEIDILVVNGEGSLHHNLPRALALLAMMSVAAERGKRVALLNATVQAMSPELLSDTLPQVGFCQVRENRTLQELSLFLPSAFTAPDIAVLSMKLIEAPYRTRAHVDGKSCLVSCGVLVNKEMLRETLRDVKRCGLEPWYLSIGDGGETALAMQVCGQENVPIIHAGEIELERLLAIMSRSAIAVSGRHHINLFLMRCGVPFVSVPSNTWKIEGTLELSGYPQQEVERQWSC